MAQVKIEDVIEHLSSQMRKALEEAVDRSIDDAEFDAHQLFREFRRAVGRKCNSWEQVPDHLVKNNN